MSVQPLSIHCVSLRRLRARLWVGAMLVAVSVLTGLPVFAQQTFEDFSGLQETAETDNTYDTSKTDPIQTIGTVIRYILSLLGIVMFAIMLIGYFIINGAGGDDEKVNKGKLWIKNGFIGILIVLAAYFLTFVFVGFFSGAGGGQVFDPGF